MSVETPPDPKSVVELPALKREALLPQERNRGLGTVAVVCTMAGVASGLALATTLMAMQVADSMTVRTCPYRVVATDVQPVVNAQPEHGFLGLRYVFREGVTEVQSILPGTPADALALRPGDHIVSVDGAPLRSRDDLQERIYNLQPGMQASLVIERNGEYQTVRPTLAPFEGNY